MAPTLYEKIWTAVNRDPKVPFAAPVTHNEGPVEVFNIYGRELQHSDSQEGNDSKLSGVVEAPPVGQKALLEKAEASIPHHRFGGGQSVARAGSGDGDRINSLTATVTAIQSKVAKDQQESNDLAHFARFANDAIRVHSGLVK